MGFKRDGENTSSTPFAELFRPNYQEDPRAHAAHRPQADRPVVHRAEAADDYFSRENNPKGVPYAVRYYGLIADILGPLIVIAIAIPFAVSGRAGQPGRRRLKVDRPFLPLFRAQEPRRVARDQAADRPCGWPRGCPTSG